jgi:DNA repair protein RadC
MDKRTISGDRRRKLASVLSAAQDLVDFSADEIKRRCASIAPGYITQTLNQLVREGALLVTANENGPLLRWNETAKGFDAATWIDRQIHGAQITETPEADRPRERLQRVGAHQLSTAELLAILIRVGVRGESAVEAGRMLVNRYAHCLEALPDASPAELRKVSRAVTSASYSQIMAGIELGRRVAAASDAAAAAGPHCVRIGGREEAIDYCRDAFARLARDSRQEEFHIVTLDTKHKPIATHRITVGTLDASLVHPREVFRPAIRDSAAAILLVHNHPSGDPTPSEADHQVTRELVEAGKLIDICVLDHIIVAADNAISLLG